MVEIALVVVVVVERSVEEERQGFAKRSRD